MATPSPGIVTTILLIHGTMDVLYNGFAILAAIMKPAYQLPDKWLVYSMESKNSYSFRGDIYIQSPNLVRRHSMI